MKGYEDCKYLLNIHMNVCIYKKNIKYHDFVRNITISPQFFVMLVLLFCLSSEAKTISLL